MPRFGAVDAVGRAFITVASSETPTKLAQYADYICDGAADEVQINAAITEVAAYGVATNTGSHVVLLPGRYTIAAPIEIISTQHRISLLGFGGYRTTDVGITANGLGATAAALRIRGQGCTVAGLWFGRSTGTTGYGIEIDGTVLGGLAGTTIQDCYIQNFSSYGIYGHGGHWYTTFDHCTVNDTGALADIYTPGMAGAGGQNGNNLVIQNCQIGGAQRGVVWSASGLFMRGCAVEVCSVAGVDIGYRVAGDAGRQALGAAIIGNTFEANNYHIRLGFNGNAVSDEPGDATGLSGNNHYGIVIDGNYFAGTGGRNYVRLWGTIVTGRLGHNGFAAMESLSGRQFDATNGDVYGTFRVADTRSDNGAGGASVLGNATVEKDRKSGTATILNGTTSIAVTHGLVNIPTLQEIYVMPTENSTADPGPLYVTTITSTQFTINCRNDPGVSNLDVMWSAESSIF